MKVIISQEHINKLKSLIDKFGIKSLGIAPYKLIEMGLIESYDGSLPLYGIPIKSLGNLKSVGDNLNLHYTPIKSLGNLKSVGGYLDLSNSKIESLGELKYVGGDLYIENCSLAELSDEEIRSQVEIKGKIYR
jgi:hypothetical protein